MRNIQKAELSGPLPCSHFCASRGPQWLSGTPQLTASPTELQLIETLTSASSTYS